MSQETKRRITAEDLYRFQLIFDGQLSPDGQHIVYSLQRVDREKEKKYANLWVVNTKGGEPRQFTYGDQSDTNARWSPDGRHIAFLSNRKDEKQSQIYVIPFLGGEARPLTDVKGNFAELTWSPDGSRLLCQFRKKDEDAIERDDDEKKKKLGIVERHITRTGFRLDGSGFLPKERWHVWTFDATSGEGIQLTAGEYDEVAPRWSPDGSSIVFISNRSEDPDLNRYEDDLHLIPADGGDSRKIETRIGSKLAPSFSPDGKWISYVSSEGKGNWWKNDGLWVVPVDGTAPARNLTEDYDIHVSNSTLGDVADRPFTTPIWTPDSQKLYFQISRHGSTVMKSITLGCELTDLATQEGVVSSFSLDRQGKTLAYIAAHFRDPGQLWVCHLESGKKEQLTQVNEAWLEEIELGEIEEAWFKGPDDNDLQGWILKPPGFDPDKRYQSILEIHGGPWLQYGDLFMHEFYFLAANDYVVCFANPRGGQGYGEAHGKAIHGHWGGADYADVMAWSDHVAKQPYIDPERMGIAGGSYGGYMTSWVIGHTNRFKAAVAQRVVSNAVSFWGSSDVGYLFENPWAENRPPWEAMERYWDQSPMQYIGNATTPTLIIHSEQDMRCNPEQGTQLYLALKRLGVDTELVLFPEESHGLSRGGRTDRRIARLNHILRWFEKYLKS